MNWKLQCAEYRAIQSAYHVFVQLLKRNYPTVVNKPGAIEAIPGCLKEDGIKKVLIITDPGLVRLGVIDKITPYIEEAGIEYAVYGECVPNPTTLSILDCLDFMQKNNAEGIVAVGGGSSMDTAKIAMSLNAMESIPDFASLAGNSKLTPKIKKPVLPLYAVPTTSGTGSEATTVAAVADPITHEKFTIQDNVVLPKRVFLDPNMTVSLPPHITAATGMDALTHAVESYLGVYYGSKETDQQGLKAVKLIMANLKTACEDGSNLKARQNMATGSYLAGLAFSLAAVGYGHSFAHASAAVCNYPHGVLTSIMLPDVLDYYFEVSKKKLAKLARVSKVTTPDRTVDEQARDFIDAVRKLRDDIGLPTKLPHLSALDVELLCERSLKEANPIYPVPRFMNMDDARAFVYRVMEEE